MSGPFWAAFVAVLASALCSCSSASDGSPQASTPISSSSAPVTSSAPAAAGSGPCGYLSRQDAATLSLRYPGSPAQQYDYGPSCDFGALLVTLIRPAVSEEAFRYGATKSVTGLGDEAYYGQDFHWLRVKKSDTRFAINCVTCQGDELPTMTKVAEKVLTHI